MGMLHDLVCHHNGYTLPMIPPGPATLPEAPCSVNGRFHVDGYPDSFQATGRGQSPHEAAQNLKATMDATRAALAPPAPPTREERLSQLLACGLTRAVEKKDFPLAQRLGKAAALVAFSMVEPGNHPGLFVVRSESTPDSWYEIEDGRCSCPDAQHHPERPCKHRLALALWQRLEEQV